MKALKRSIIVAVAIFGLVLLGSTGVYANQYPAVGDWMSFYLDNGGNIVNNGNTEWAGSFGADVIGRGATDAPDYYTFCLERSESLNPFTHVQYYVDGISDAAIVGGSDAAHGSVGPAPGADPLDARTAYLYSGFVRGTLAGWTGSVQDAKDLQVAIWMIEQELLPADSAYDTSNKFFVLANASGWRTTGGVKVVNLTKDDIHGEANNNRKQDVLTLVPEPSMMLLFGTGLLGLGIFGRRKKS